MPEKISVHVEERREEPDLAAIWELLRAVDLKITVHIAEDAISRPALLQMISIFSQAKGVITFIKWSAAVATFCSVIYAFLALHITWRP